MKLKLLIAFTLLASIVSAQNKLVSYEYWFNNDYTNVQKVAITPTQTHLLNTNFDITALPNNLNVLNIRYKDENGKYSSTLSKLFVKLPDAEIVGTNNLVSYEYWFNNDYANVQKVAITPTQTHLLNTNFDITALPNNLNVLNIRYKDENGKYSSTLSKLFVKVPDAEIVGTNNLVSYEYWFNNDYTNVQTVAISPTQTHLLNTNFDITALPNNLNVLNIRYKDENGKYSSTLSKLFVKLPDAEIVGSNNLVSYEYWFNNDYANVQKVAITPTQTHLLNTNFDITALPNNVNVLNIRYKDENGKYSSTLSKLFVKLPNSHISSDNKLISYKYWFDDDFANAVTVIFSTSTKEINVLEVIDVTRIPKGNHKIYYQFLDTMGVWSVVNHHDFAKTSFPLSEFSYELTTTCDSTVVAFTNTSIDCDANLWNFGDGSISTDNAPEHVYHFPGVYVVTHTAKDTATLLYNTTTKTIHVSGITRSTISTTVCNSYTSPSGKVFTLSGTYLDTILNTWSCDSVITLNLTINPLPNVDVSQNRDTLIAIQEGATYQWLDCSSNLARIDDAIDRYFTATEIGNYAVEVTLNGCVDTSACYSVTEVGIIETTFDSDIILYPNPANDVVTVETEAIGSAITITDLTGRIVLQATATDSKTILDISELSAGTYVVRVGDKVGKIWKM